MYTRCPKCKTVFEASPEDLSAHDGLVRCGECDEVFHVLENQIDQEEITLGGAFADSINRILDESEAAEDATDEQSSGDEPSPGDESINEYFGNIELKPVADVSQPNPEIYKRRLTRDDADIPPLDQNEIEQLEEELSPAPATAGFADPDSDPGQEQTVDLDEIQPELDLHDAIAAGVTTHAQQNSSAKKHSRAGLGWSIGVAVLLALAAIQASVHVEGIRTNPALRPTLESICGVLGCSGVLQKDGRLVSITDSNKIDSAPGEFTLTSRIRNNASFEEKLPDLEVSLTNSFQMMIGRRTFTPDQYLANKQLAAKGTLAPGQEVEASLRLVSDGLQVSGYELHLRNPE